MGELSLTAGEFCSFAAVVVPMSCVPALSGWTEADASAAPPLPRASAACVVVAALLSSFGVELAMSMFFSPLTMDEPLGASVSPDPEAPVASCALRLGGQRSATRWLEDA